MIEIKDLTFSYDKTEVFSGLNLSIKEGEFVAILGHNGSGKSTLSKLLVGLETPRAGELWVAGLKSSEETIAEIRKKISIVFQNPDNQFVGATVADDIAFGLENQQVPRDEMVALVATYLNKMGLEGLEHAPPHELSGGQKQRTAIAGALAIGADVLILDEATSMLDPAGRADIMKLVRELAQDAKRTIIMITHHLDEAVYADRIVVLNEGQIVKDGTPLGVFDDVEGLAAIGLDVPFAVRASKMLYERQVIKKICVTNEELVAALC
ncbi:MAG: energy-coupling factor transporter ATPase [Turicibacter sp.]|nr:energy-coupling factor transporter ATPase [Turicibacter sp.]